MRRTHLPQLHGAAFEEFVRRHAHATLSEMASAWHAQSGVSLNPIEAQWHRLKNRVRTNRLCGMNFKDALETALL